MTIDVLVILDRSGSMQSAKADHEGGLRSFVNDQKQLDGDVRFTLVQFDTTEPCEIVYDRTPIADVKAITLTPRGGTPLLDAIGLATSHLEKHTPETVVCMVITDGEENESREWTKPRIKQRVTDLEKAGWTFLFLGAGIDAFAEAGALGFSAAATLDSAHSGVGLRAAYMATSHNFAGMRMASATRSLSPQARASAMSYTKTQRSAAIGKRPIPPTFTSDSTNDPLDNSNETEE